MRPLRIDWPGWAPVLGAVSSLLVLHVAQAEPALILPARCGALLGAPPTDAERYAVLAALVASPRELGDRFAISAAPLAVGVPDIAREIPAFAYAPELECGIAVSALTPTAFTEGSWLGTKARLVPPGMDSLEAAQSMGGCMSGLVCDAGTDIVTSTAFSAPVFSRDRRYALVYVDYECGVLCASGVWILLEQRQQRWEIAGGWTEWVS